MKKGLMKVVALAAASVMAVAALAGCGSSDKLIMGTNAAFPPFEYTTSQGLVGEFDGIDVAIANKIAEALKNSSGKSQLERTGDVAIIYTKMNGQFEGQSYVKEFVSTYEEAIDKIDSYNDGLGILSDYEYLRLVKKGGNLEFYSIAVTNN